MRPKSLTLLAGLLTGGLLALPACGGDDESTGRPAAGSVPREEVQGVERRVSDLEKEIMKLRRDLEGVRNEQSSAEDAGDDTASAADPSSAGAGAGAEGGAGSGAGTGSSGGGSGAGSGSGGGSSGLGNEGGGGPDPGTREDDPTVEDICGENPAPTC